MKMRIEGKYGERPAWLEWEDGEVTGSHDAVELLQIKEKVLKDETVAPEYFSIENTDATYPLPYRVLFLCIEYNYGVGPVFDFGTAKYELTGFPERIRPEGAV